MGRTREVSKILTSDTVLATDVELAAVQNSLGLVSITPSSVAATGGSATISSSGAVSFTSASAISINDVFSATFDNYKIICSLTGSTSTESTFRFLTGSTALTTGYSSRQATLGATYSSTTKTNGFQIGVTRAGASFNTGEINVSFPFLAERKSMTAISADFADPSEIRVSAGHQTDQTSRNGFQIFPASGTITGVIYTFGVKK